MSQEFTEEEIIKLRELLEVAETVEAEAHYKAAVKLVIKTWKNVVLSLAAFIGAVLILKDSIAKIWSYFIGG